MRNNTEISKTLNSWRQLAYKEALKATGKHRHGAVIVGSGGRILSKACNNYDNGYHAEIRAICRIPHDALKTAMKLIVVRLRNSQQFGLSKPCIECEKAIREAKIQVVYYSTDIDGVLYSERYVR